MEPQGSCIKVVFRARIIEEIPHSLLQQVRNEAQTIPGFLGIQVEVQGDQETACSYWSSRQAIAAWAVNPVHLDAKRQRDRFYDEISLEILEGQALPPELST